MPRKIIKAPIKAPEITLPKPSLNDVIYSEYAHGKNIAMIALERSLETNEVFEIITAYERTKR